MLKFILFLFVLLYASIYDLKHLTVPTHVHICLFLVGLINVNLYSLIGWCIAFIPLFLATLFMGGIGGGDIKLAGMCGWVMQGLGGLLGTIIGFILAILIMPIIRKLKKQSKQTPFALVPYISIGCLLLITLGGQL